MYKIEEITIAGIQEAFDSGELTSWDLTAAYMERIADIDTSGPALNSVLELNPDALYIAEAMDRERKLKCPRGPLHGVPVLIKDNINRPGVVLGHHLFDFAGPGQILLSLHDRGHLQPVHRRLGGP